MTTSVRLGFVFVVCLFFTSPVWATNWTQFRGAGSKGLSDETGLPVTWSESQNLKWRTQLPGPGSSSPIVLGDRVYVTCFSGVSEEEGSTDNLKRHLVCLDRQEGKIIWDSVVPAEQPEDPYRGQLTQHGYASQTPVIDGQRIYAFFGKSGVLAFDLQGNKLWQVNVGTESSPMRWGSGASPILYKDFVIVNASDESQSIRALDKATGKEVWKAEAAGLENVYNTPTLVSLQDGTQELVISAAGEVWGLNPDTGKLTWYLVTDLQGQVSPSVVCDGEVLFIYGGRGSGGLAARAGGKGDVTNTHVIWSSRDGSSVPTPVLFAGHLYWLDDSGVAHCVDAKTGKAVYANRLAGMAAAGGAGGRGRGGFGGAGGGPAVYASMVCADGKLYAVTRRNGTFVLAAKPEFEQLAHNRFESDNSQSNASPAISNGELFLRSDKYLYCVAAE